jgi:hypothetical protein
MKIARGINIHCYQIPTKALNKKKIERKKFANIPTLFAAAFFFTS